MTAGGSFISLDFPLAQNTVAIGINDSGEVAGYYQDAALVNHGFIYANGVFSRVDVTGGSGTELTRITNQGAITGLYLDSSTVSESHGIRGH